LIKAKIPINKIRRIYFVGDWPYATLDNGCEYSFEFCAGPDDGAMWLTGEAPECLAEDHCEDCPVTVVEHDAT
jgi:hypothetical protein